MILTLFFMLIIAVSVSLTFFSGLSLWFIPLWIFIGILISVLGVILSLVLGFPLASKNKPEGKLRHGYVRALSDFARFFMRIKIDTVIGRENIPEGNCVIFGNHKSNTDPFILVSAIRKPMGFAAKSGIFTIPIVKKWLPRIGCININRDNDREAIKEILVGINNVEKGLSLAIFPEGGIKDRTTHLMHDVKPGAYKLATKPGVPILPVALIGNRFIINRAPYKKSKITLIILKPLYKEEYQDMSTVEIGELVKERINEAIIAYEKKTL